MTMMIVVVSIITVMLMTIMIMICSRADNFVLKNSCMLVPRE